MTTENLSLLETKHLVEKSRGKLTMMVLRDDRKFLVSIPEVVDSTPNSEEDRRHNSSSELEGENYRGRGWDYGVVNVSIEICRKSKSTKGKFRNVDITEEEFVSIRNFRH